MTISHNIDKKTFLTKAKVTVALAAFCLSLAALSVGDAYAVPDFNMLSTDFNINHDSANGLSTAPDISADGKVVVFTSDADNLVDGDTNGMPDVFVKDLSDPGNPITTLVSKTGAGAPADGGSFEPAVSENGRYVAYVSFANNIIPGDVNTRPDILVYDRQEKKTALASVNENDLQIKGINANPSVTTSDTGDQVFIVFDTDAKAVITDTTSVRDVYMRKASSADLSTGETARVSVSSNEDGGASVQGNLLSQNANLVYNPSEPVNKLYVVFESDASTLLGQFGDTNHHRDVYGRAIRPDHIDTGKTDLISNSAVGQGQGNADSLNADVGLSQTYGFVVAYESQATNIVDNDTNASTDIFAYLQSTGNTIRASVNSSGGQGDGASNNPSVDAVGTFVAFDSTASNLIDNDSIGVKDVFKHELAVNKTSRLSENGYGAQGNGSSSLAKLSSGGEFAAFQSEATNLDAGVSDNNESTDVLLWFDDGTTQGEPPAGKGDPVYCLPGQVSRQCPANTSEKGTPSDECAQPTVSAEPPKNLNYTTSKTTENANQYQYKTKTSSQINQSTIGIFEGGTTRIIKSSQPSGDCVPVKNPEVVAASAPSCEKPLYINNLIASREIRLKDLLGRGLRAKVSASHNSKAVVKVEVEGRSARYLRIFRKKSRSKAKALASTSLTLKAGKTKAVKLVAKGASAAKIKRALGYYKLRKTTKLKLSLTSTATDKMAVGANQKPLSRLNTLTTRAKLKGKANSKRLMSNTRRVEGVSPCVKPLKASITGPKDVKLSKLVTGSGRQGRGVKVKVSCSLDCTATVGNYLWGRYGVALKFWKPGGKKQDKAIYSKKGIHLKAGQVVTLTLKGASSSKKRKLLQRAASSGHFKRVKIKYMIDAVAVGAQGQRASNGKTARLRLK